MVSEFIKAFGLIFLAEMGDKTQILAMAFATRYPLRQVLWGIFFGVLLNHGLAVLLGNLLSSILPFQLIQVIAGLTFLAFALWSLRTEEEETQQTQSSRGPIMTVALAFFIGELGDKTQLSAITLSSTSNYPVIVLAATVSGMLLVGFLGIIIARTLGHRIPEMAMKLAAAAAFAFFGLTKLWQHLPADMIESDWLLPVLLLYLTGAGFLVLRLRRQTDSVFRRQAEELKQFYQAMGETLDKICLHCRTCAGDGCHIGYSKILVSQAIKGTPSLKQFIEQVDRQPKTYRGPEVDQALAATDKILQTNPHDVSLLALKKQLRYIQAEHLPESEQVLKNEAAGGDGQPKD